MRNKTVRRRAIRAGLVTSNVIILVAILAFVLQNPGSDNLPTSSALASSSANASSNPLDQVSSADIALTVARINSLSESTAINNQAQSQAADVAIATTTNNVTAKPAVIATALKSRADIQSYTTQAGDTVSTLATKYGVTSDSIRWSNGLTGDLVPAGTTLSIPPVNGIVYIIKDGDTSDSLATKFKVSKDQIIAYNDTEISGFKTGDKVLIPGGSLNVVGTTAATIASGGKVSNNPTNGAGFAWGTTPMYGVNGYDYGYCTWYVATQVGVPGNWGNASTWAYYAANSGWNVSTTPTVGAIAQRGGGEGHVALVTAVNDDGTVEIRDMNGSAGWGRVGTGTRSVSTFQHYITR